MQGSRGSEMALGLGLEEGFMSSVSVGDVPSERWMPVSMSIFAEGISHVLYKWYSLQSVVAADAGIQTPDIHDYIMSSSASAKSAKVDQLSADIFDWFTQPKELHEGNSLATMLDNKIRHSFGMPLERETVGNVADRLMKLHEECLQGKYQSIEELRKSYRLECVRFKKNSSGKIVVIRKKKKGPLLSKTSKFKRASVSQDMKIKRLTPLLSSLSSLRISDVP